MAGAAAQPTEGFKEVDAQLAQILTQARQWGASDVHIVADRPPLIRRVGALSPVGEPLPKGKHSFGWTVT